MWIFPKKWHILVIPGTRMTRYRHHITLACSNEVPPVGARYIVPFCIRRVRTAHLSTMIRSK